MSNTTQSSSSWLLDLHPKPDTQALESPDDLGVGAAVRGGAGSIARAA
jgi:hypothetical protein